MQMELQEPFKSLWRIGYLKVDSSTGRKYVNLFNSNEDRSIVSYARYLMCVHLGYILSSEYEVDHRNDDRTDDRLDNLQVLTGEQNRIKKEILRAEEEIAYGYYCAYCDCPFIISPGERNHRLKHSKTQLAFCCHEHSRIYMAEAGIAGKVAVSIEIQNQIRQLRAGGLSSYRISEITGLARNTVMKYW